MRFSTLATAFALAVDATALPQAGKPQTYVPASSLDNLAKIFPQSALPCPDASLTLKYVVLGIGTQNYTCGSDPNAAPGTTGAFASLYDIGTSLNKDPWAGWKLSSIAPLMLSMSEWAPAMVDMSLRSQGYEHLAGHHFFAEVDGSNTPTFAFDQLSAPFPLTQVAKLNATDAPANACPGRNGLPAVQWLYLQHKNGLAEGGINTVYRVETAGGNKPATCQGMPPSWEVKYAAQYWVYGPKQ